MLQSADKFRGKRLINSVLLIVVAVLLLVIVARTRTAPLHNDFVEYWAASKLLLAGHNPYSPAAMLATELSTGFQGRQALLMWNPPWALPFVLPLGTVSYSTASALWLLLSLVIVFACADWLWLAYGGNRKRRWAGWLLAASFFPLLTAMGLGQIGPLMLLGVTLFLRWQSSRPLLAGAATVLIALKPQLLYLFWIVLLLQGVRRSWKLLAGAALALFLASAFPLLFERSIWSNYLDLARSGAVLRYPSPNLGTLLRSWLGNWALLQFVPPMIGTAWVVFFWGAKRQNWSWTAELPLLLLVSLVTTAYGWLFDQIVLLPAMMQLAAPLVRSQRRLWLLPSAAYAGVNALMMLCVFWKMTGTAYTWTAPAWLLIYLGIRWGIVRGKRLQGTAVGLAAVAARTDTEF